MLEYETANPGQDRAKEEGQHFNPDHDTSNPRVSFAPEDYAAMEEGRTHGIPKEYGTERRPFSESPAPPHPNDQFAGLADGGMHAEELVKPMRSIGGDSDRTLASNSVPAQTMMPPTSTQGAPQAAHKSAMRPASKGNGQMAVAVANGKDRSVRSNTQMNRNINSGMPRDEEFYDDKE